MKPAILSFIRLNKLLWDAYNIWIPLKCLRCQFLNVLSVIEPIKTLTVSITSISSVVDFWVNKKNGLFFFLFFLSASPYSFSTVCFDAFFTISPSLSWGCSTTFFLWEGLFSWAAKQNSTSYAGLPYSS